MMDSNLVETQSITGVGEASPRTRPLGQLLVAMGALSQSQLARVLEIQRAQRPGDKKPLGRICIEQGYLSRERLNSILDRWSKRLRLGELLVNRGHVTPDQLEAALERQRQSDKRLGEILIDMNVIDEQILTETLAEQFDIPYVPLRDLNLSSDLKKLINASYAMRHGVVPIGRIGRRLTVAIQDPTDHGLISDLEHSTGLQIQPVMARPTEVAATWRRLYETGEWESDQSSDDLEAGDVEVGPTADRLLQQLVAKASSIQASELIVESNGESGAVSIRVDSELHPMPGMESLARQIPILARTLLISARLDPSEELRPQQGYAIIHAESDLQAEPARLLVETHPGTKNVMVTARIDGTVEDRLSVGLAGPGGDVYAGTMAMLREAKGIFLVVGPTGSGKRRFLRKVLGSLVGPDRKVLSIEDPILGRSELVMQQQVDPSGGPSCADLLNGDLAQGSDVVGLERIVDPDTASEVFAQRDGNRLIVSTIRASNSTAAISRLLGLGVGPGAIASSLVGVLAMRLLRRNCTECEESYEPRRPIVDEWFLGAAPYARWRRGTGCPHCNGTGFAGTFPIHELWIPTADQLNVIGPEFDEQGFRELVLVTTRCLGQNALQRAIEGRSTLEDALKLIPYQDVVYTRLHGLQLEKNRTTRFIAG